MDKIQLPLIQGFLLSISSKNSILHLEAEEKSSGRNYAINLDSDSIVQVTNGLFDNADKMAQGLNDAASGNCPELKITIDSQGKLTYSAVFSAGVIHKEYSFALNIPEVIMNPEEILQKRLSVLEKGKEEHEIKVNSLKQDLQVFQGKTEERFNKLENMIIQMEQKMSQRFDALEKFYEVRNGQVADLQKEELKKPVVCFNDLSVNKSNYEYDSSKTTVKLIAEQGNHPCLNIDPQIPRSGQHSYSLKINTKTGPLAFGITTKREEECWNGPNYQYFWSETGRIHGKVSREPDQKSVYCGQSSILKMVVDIDRGTLTFFVDEKQINSCEISTSESYFANLSLAQVGDSVTLI